MGKIYGRRRPPSIPAESPNRVDKWFSRASHTSQVLLLLLGVFGYFYTVLPIYQKSLLDEEIAEKTLRLREQEKQVVALNVEISQKQADLIAKERQVLDFHPNLTPSFHPILSPPIAV
jgi:hypothetical protein